MRNERGIALILTLLVVALLTITVVEFTYSVEIDQHMARNALNGLQASLLARSGIALGEALLLQDTNMPPNFDAFTEEWCPSQENLVNNDRPSCVFDASNSQLIVPDNMRLRVQIVDEGGKLNLNMTRPQTKQEWQQSLTNPNAPPQLFQSWRTALEHLMQAHGVDASVSDAVEEYWNQWWSSQPLSALPTPNPLQPGGTPTPSAQQLLLDFPSLDDAAVIPGFSSDVIRRLRSAVTALKTFQRTVNVNTASREVLSAIIPDGGAVDEIVSRRQQDGFKTMGEVSPILGAASLSDPASRNVSRMLGVNSYFFLIRASAIVNPNPVTGLGGISRSASMLVFRYNFKPNPPPGMAHWTLTRLDWQKEGGAGLFQEKTDQEPGTEGAPMPMGG